MQLSHGKRQEMQSFQGFWEPFVVTHKATKATHPAGSHALPRAQVVRDTRGFIKLVADAATGRILGAHVLAEEAGEVIQAATLAVRLGLTPDDLTDTLLPYLTQVEELKLAALSFTKDIAKLSCCAV